MNHDLDTKVEFTQTEDVNWYSEKSKVDHKKSHNQYI